MSFSYSDEMQTINGIIEKANIGFVGYDGAFMDIRLCIKYDSAGQCFGGYNMGTRDKVSPYFSYVVHGILSTLEIDDWNDLKNTPIRVYGNTKGIKKIGHLVKDKWFSFEGAKKHMDEDKNDNN